MFLLNDWRRIVTKAYSFRLMVLAGLLSGIEVALPIFADSFPQKLFAILSFTVTCAALWARLVAQPKMHDDA